MRETEQEVDWGLHDFGTELTPASLSPSLCLWVLSGSEDEEGVGFPLH